MKNKSFFSRFNIARKILFSRANGYDASKSTRRRARRRESQPKPEHLALDLSDRARVIGTLLDYRRNNPLVASICRLRETDVVGNGIFPQAMSGDEELDKKLEEKWNEFSRSPEVTFSMTMRDLQKSLASMPIIFGDGGLILTKTGRVQLVEGDRIGTDEGQGFHKKQADQQKEKDGKRIIDGVELTPQNAPRAYHIGTREDGFLKDVKRISARNFIFHRKRIRPTQIRGIPELAPVADDLQDLDEYDEIEMISAKVSASLSAVVKREGAMDFELAEDDEDSDRLETFNAGQFHYLEAGEDISVIGSGGRPNTQAIPYIHYRLQKIGACLGIPLEFLLQTIGDTSFSASQGMILLYQATIESEQRDLIPVLAKLWRWKVSNWIADGSIEYNKDEVNPFEVRWQPPAFRWVNRVAQVKADATYLGLGAISLDDVSATFGHDANTSLERKAKNIRDAKRIAEEYGIDDWQELFNPFPTTAQANFAELLDRDQNLNQGE
jgi:lambda family phage portal protein